MERRVGAGAVALAAIFATTGATAMPAKCAKPPEVTAIQAAAIQQELMVAALTCNEVDRFNAFQTGYNKELRASDSTLEHMFKRLFGGSRGEDEYHAFKTRLANDSSMKSIRNNPDYCREAGNVFAAALGPQKPTLTDFVSGIQVDATSPVDSCEIKVAVGLAGAKVAPNVVPKPNPLRLANLAPPASPVAPATQWPTPSLTPPPATGSPPPTFPSANPPQSTPPGN
jgi:hypothetical protein